MIDTARLADGEWVTVMPEPEDKGPKCPNCGVEFHEWNCLGCDYEWST